MLIIGESLNATRKTVREAVKAQDVSFIQSLAIEQAECGANMLDVNAAVTGRCEAEDLVWMVENVQKVVNIPLVLDSSDPDALTEAMKVHQGRPIINSLSAETDKLEKLLPVVSNAECDVIVLCMDDNGIPSTIEGRLAVARYIVGKLAKNGKKTSNLYVDPLVMPLSVDMAAPQMTLDLFKQLHSGLPEFAGVHTIGGLSNVSFGMPNRGLLNSHYITMAIANGMDSCIVDVRNKDLMSGIYAAEALVKPVGMRTYLKLCRKGIIK